MTRSARDKNVAAALQRCDEKFQALVETIGDWVWEVDREGVYTYASPKVRDLIGYEPEEILGKTPFDLMPPHEAARVKRLFRSLAASRLPIVALENVNVRKDGRLVILETSGTPILDADGTLRGYRGVDREITTRKESERSLRESEERFRRLFEQSPLGTVLVSLDGRFLRVNEAYSRITGYSPAELLSRTIGDITHPEDTEAGLAQAKRLIAGEIESFTMEKRYIRKDGRVVWMRLNVQGIRDEKGHLLHLLGFIEDITEHIESRETLREGEQRFRLLFDQSPLGAALVSLDYRFLRVNEAFSRITGYSSEELLSMSFTDITHPEDLTEDLAGGERLFSGQIDVHQMEKRYIRKDGDVVWVRLRVRGIRDEAGRFRYFLPVVEDITETKKVQEALRSQEALLRHVLETAPVGVWFINREGRIVVSNAEGRRIWGGARYVDAVDYAEHEGWRAHSGERVEPGEWWGGRAIAGGETSLNEEIEIEGVDGNRKTVINSVVPSRDERGRITGAIVVNQDITERRRIEEALAAAQQRLSAHIDNSPLAVVEFDPGFRVVRWSKEAERLFGWTAEEIVGKAIAEMRWVHEEDEESVRRLSEDMLKGKTPRNVHVNRNYRKDGKLVRCEWYNSAIYDAQGRMTSVLSRVLDITGRVEAEEALRRSHEELEERVWKRTADLAQANEALRKSLRFELLNADLSARFVNLHSDEVDREIEGALAKVRAFFGVDRCGLAEVGQETGEVQITHMSTGDDIPTIPTKVDYIGLYPWSTERTIRRGEILHMHARDFPPEAAVDRASAESMGVKSFLTIPLLSEGAVRHLIHISILNDGKVWEEEYTPRLRLIGEILVNALERKRTDAALRQTMDSLQRTMEEVQRLRDRLQVENVYLREQLGQEAGHAHIVGESGRFLKMLAKARRVAPTDSTVLITGETGTGKELLAQAIHAMSGRSGRTMVTVSCAALPPALIEGELFGRERGAYTGATTRQMGRIEVADGSTLFLDEIGDLPVDLQVKLLRVLQDGRFERLGSHQTLTADIRVIAATHRDLGAMVRDGRFREDLFHRLNVYPIEAPPLRARSSDIPLLVWTFVQEFNGKMGKSVDSISNESMARLMRYPWPGNIRELRNVVERAMIGCDGSSLTIELPSDGPANVSVAVTMEEAERKHIREALERARWRIRGKQGAAEILGLRPTTLHSKMKKLGISRPKP